MKVISHLLGEASSACSNLANSVTSSLLVADGNGQNDVELFLAQATQEGVLLQCLGKCGVA